MGNDQAVRFLIKGGDEWTRFQDTVEELDFTDAPIKTFNLGGRTFLKPANFDRATFEWVELSGSEFKKGATFKNAKFNKQARITPQGAGLNETLDFSEAEFLDDVHIKVGIPCHLIFGRAKFHKRLSIVFGPAEGLDFSSAEFRGDVTVSGKIGQISFEKARFGIDNPVNVTFSKAELEGYANFENALFLGEAVFQDTKFRGASSFVECTFHRAPNFHDAELHQGTRFSHHDRFPHLFLDTQSPDASNAYRTLKLAMNEQHALSEELGFFLLEMRSSAHHQKPGVKALYWLYDGLSRYGMSVKRPLLFLIAVNAVAGLVFSVLAGRGWGAWDPELLALTLYGAIPFAPALRSQVPEMSSLFPLDAQPIVPVVVAIQGLFNAALLFLVLLGLRNIFKIK